MRLYNSLTKKVSEVIPLIRKEIRIYVCGITPYDTTHIGHAFTYVFFDALVRYLRYKNYNVIYTQNVTDIDDDILKRAKMVGQNWKDLGDFWTDRYLTDMKNLNVLPPTYYTRATGSIPEIIMMVQNFIKKGCAYEKKGNVYFQASKFKEYGKLSGYQAETMMELLNKRGGNTADPLKREPLDFLLWQKSKNDEPAWESPWGAGRPGWHIECSAMIYKTLGMQIDIHGGGHDLIFPHHESEIAQSESFSGKKPFAKYWLHTAMVRYNGEKMSKSLGNLVLVSDLLKKYSANAIRYILLSHRFQETWEFMESELDQAEKDLSIIYTAMRIRPDKKSNHNPFKKEFINLMDNNINTPAVLKMSVDIAKEKSATSILKEIFFVLGFKETNS